MQSRGIEKEEINHVSLLGNKAISTSLSALGLYPFRMLQTISANHANYTYLYQEALPKVAKLDGFAWHMVRCSGMLALQTTSKKWAESYCEANKRYSIMAGLVATTITGSLWASFVETGFNRKVAKPLAMSVLKTFPLLRFSRQLLANYGIREFNFSVPVFFKSEMATDTWIAATAASAVITTVNTKIIFSESSYDIIQSLKKQPNEKCVPNYASDGWIQSLRQVAQGGVYTHPAYQAHFRLLNRPAARNELPDSMRKVLNVLLVYCSYPVLTHRLLYLVACAVIIEQSNLVAEKFSKNYGFFNRNSDQKPLAGHVSNFSDKMKLTSS